MHNGTQLLGCYGAAQQRLYTLFSVRPSSVQCEMLKINSQFEFRCRHSYYHRAYQRLISRLSVEWCNNQFHSYNLHRNA